MLLSGARVQRGAGLGNGRAGWAGRLMSTTKTVILRDGNAIVTIQDMPLTRNFKETVQARAQRDPAFREELLKEGVECLLAGEVDAGKIILRDYINATMGFEELGSLMDKSPKSLMRMFGPAGNPHARNLFEVISRIQEHEGVQLEVKAIR